MRKGVRNTVLNNEIISDSEISGKRYAIENCVFSFIINSNNK